MADSAATQAKGAEVLGVSTDSVHSHLAYRRLEPSAGGPGEGGRWEVRLTSQGWGLLHFLGIWWTLNWASLVVHEKFRLFGARQLRKRFVWGLLKMLDPVLGGLKGKLKGNDQACFKGSLTRVSGL